MATVAGPLYDNFTTSQASGTTDVYSPTSGWGPSGTRSIPPDADIGLTVLGHYNVLSNDYTLTELTYTFNPPLDVTNLLYFTLTNIKSTGSQSTFINIYYNLSNVPVGVAPINTSSTPQSVTVPITPGTTTVNQVIIAIPAANIYVGPFSTTYAVVVCVGRDSLILSPNGDKYIQDLQRGEEIIGGKIARIIREEPGLVEAVYLPKDCLEPGLPKKDTYLCSEHYLVYKGKRRIAKSFLAYPGVKVITGSAKDILPLDEEGKPYFYDIQFDHEGEYIVNGMISQSRSPYALVSPLPKELYFEEKNYKEERVLNTLCEEPQISTKYLLPNGEEAETFFKLVPRD